MSEAYSKPFQITKMMRTLAFSKQFIQTFSGVFRDINIEYSVMFREIKVYRGILRHMDRILFNPYIKPYHYRSLSYLEPQASSKESGTRKIRYIQSTGIVRTVFSNIFKDS